ncbi:hypothetical protein BH23BAC3_BH23BAC3_32050 [soil metagenome]
MKKQIIFLIYCIELLSAGNLAAQSTGSITGTVIDAESGETIVGANVVIEGPTIGASTDVSGEYSIRNIAPGSYNLLISYISYRGQKITGVEVVAGESVRLEFLLQPEREQLDDVIVTAGAILSSEAGLLRQR